MPAALVVGATAGAVASMWPEGADRAKATTGTGTGSGPPSTTQPRSPKNDDKGNKDDKNRPVPHAPPGYRLLFANKPFIFTPPPSDGQANHLDLDIPRSTYLERAALPGPAELVHNSDGRLGSILVVVGERETVCTEEQQIAVLSRPLPAAELRLGRQVKMGTILCSITSNDNDNAAEAEITEIIPRESADGLPTYKGYVTAWTRPAPNLPG